MSDIIFCIKHIFVKRCFKSIPTHITITAFVLIRGFLVLVESLKIDINIGVFISNSLVITSQSKSLNTSAEFLLKIDDVLSEHS